ERRREHVRRREAVEDDGSRVAGERGERVVVRSSRVDDDGLPELGRELELLLEEAALGVAGRVVAEPVETRLPHRDRLRMPEQLAERGDVLLRRVARLVRMKADDREDAVVRVRERERTPAVRDVGADGEDP